MSEEYRFEWDDAKAALNEHQVQISFDEAATVFYDPYAYINYDSAHSAKEHREIIIGFSSSHRLLFVSFVERHPYKVRIISARKLTPPERKLYEKKTR